MLFIYFLIYHMHHKCMKLWIKVGEFEYNDGLCVCHSHLHLWNIWSDDDGAWFFICFTLLNHITDYKMDKIWVLLSFFCRIIVRFTFTCTHTHTQVLINNIFGFIWKSIQWFFCSTFHCFFIEWPIQHWQKEVDF